MGRREGEEGGGGGRGRREGQNERGGKSEPRTWPRQRLEET
jgi:hypothetical protein